MTAADPQPPAPSSAAGLTATADGAGQAPPARRGGRFSLRTFASLRQREFRWLFASTLGQMAAIQMQILMRSYVAYDLTDSFAAIGVVGLASAVPMLLLSVFGGVLADRVPRKRILQVGHVLNMGFAILIGVLLLLGMLRVEHLFVIALVQGIVLALTISAGQAFVPEVAGRERLMNAVSLNAAGMSFMRLLAPAAAALIIALVGTGSAYLTIAVLYCLALIMLVPVRARRPGAMGAVPSAGGAGGLRDLMDGLRYATSNRVIFWVLVLNFVTAILAMPYMVQLPGYVADVFAGGPTELALLAAVSGGRIAPRDAHHRVAAGAAARHVATRQLLPARPLAGRIRRDIFLLARLRDHVRRRRLDRGAAGDGDGARPELRGRRASRPRDVDLHDPDLDGPVRRVHRRTDRGSDGNPDGDRGPRAGARGLHTRRRRAGAAAAPGELTPPVREPPHPNPLPRGERARQPYGEATAPRS